MSIPGQRWPARLWVVRHGQSAGNVARDAAERGALARIALDGRDMDVPLSPLGQDQARALGHWFAGQPAAERPEILLASPYARACRTAALFRDAGGTATPDTRVCADERLREKEFGILDGLTPPGIAAHLPDQAEFRRLLGKFYHRPPGGESWCDVILRLRSLLDTVTLHHAGQRVMIVAHQVVVLCLRYVLEGLDEAAILRIDAEANVANCGVTEYAHEADDSGAGRLVLVRYNMQAPVAAEGVPATAAPDAPAAARG